MADDDLCERVAALELRVRQLEDALARGGPAVAPPPYRDAPAPARDAAPPRGDVETTLGLHVFNRVGAVVVLLGLVLGVGWARERGYLGALPRLGLGLGAALLAFRHGLGALADGERGRRAYGVGVTLVGALGVLVVAYAAAHVDHAVPPGVAVAAGAAWSVVLGVLAWRRSLRALWAMAMVAALAVPLLSGGRSDDVVALWTWLAVASAAGAAATVRVPLPGALAALAPGIVIYAAATVRGPVTALVAAGCAALPVALLGVGLAGRRAPGLADRFAAAAGAAGLGVVATALAFTGHVAPAAGLAAAAAAALVAGALQLRERGLDGDGRATALAFTAAAPLALAAAPLADASLVVTALACAVVAAILARAGRRGRFRGAPRLALGAVSLAAAVVHADRGLGLSAPLSPTLALELLAVAAAAAVVALAAPRRQTVRALAFVAAHALLVSLAWRAAVTFAAPATSAPWAASAALVVHGLVALGAGAWREHTPTRWVGLALLFAAGAKVLAVDVWTASPGVRVAAFLTLGVGLLAASFVYGRRVDRRGRRTAPAAPAAPPAPAAAPTDPRRESTAPR